MDRPYYANIHKTWLPLFDLWKDFINQIIDDTQDKTTYPPQHQIFRVFSMNVNKIKVVFLGQDPYHGENQATGLSFSCDSQKTLQPSLRNIFKELKEEFPERNYILTNGDLSRWFNKEKIFLLNTALTVISGQPNSLSNRWELFTDAVIDYISKQNDKCVFLLMGGNAKAKRDKIQNPKRIITCGHPSPANRNNDFIGSFVFQRVEKLIGEINWETDNH
jgi:uracil-DNA glycosylase